MWGLNSKQFDTVFKAMAKPVEAEVQGMTIRQAVKAVKVPREFPIKWAPGTEAIADDAGKIDHPLRLYGRGTALGIILNEAGLGFLPQRQPNGTLGLLITKQSKEPLWPIGWLPTLSLNKTVPQFYKQKDVSLPNVSLTRVFKAVEGNTKIPIIVDHYHIRAKGQELEKMMAKVNPRKMSMNRVIRTVTVQNRIGFDVRIDEIGKPFIWISTTEVINRRKDRFKK